MNIMNVFELSYKDRTKCDERIWVATNEALEDLIHKYFNTTSNMTEMNVNEYKAFLNMLNQDDEIIKIVARYEYLLGE